MEKLLTITRIQRLLSADGTVAIGAYGNDGNGSDSGRARIYQRNSSTNAWEQVTLTSMEGCGDYSGYGVSLLDGSTVAIGAYGNDGSLIGHVRIYQRNSSTNTWEQVGADIDGEAADDYSGVACRFRLTAAPSHWCR